MNTNTVLKVDAKGLACPLPLVRTKKAIDTLASGEVLELDTTDAGAGKDLIAWTTKSGHELLAVEQVDGVQTFRIRKG
jgi:tRNA 2-thiouridine synthesizing protein A